MKAISGVVLAESEELGRMVGCSDAVCIRGC